jgi:hypothetical protein
MRKLSLFALLFLLPALVTAQKNKRYRWEVGVDLGAANFLGDLGGANQVGTHFVKDLEISLTSPAVGIHMRYRAGRYFAYRANFGFGKIYGDDKLTQETYRNNRNLNFKSNIIEFSAVVEVYTSKERPGHLYNYKKVKGWRHIDIQTYGFIGIGGFYFNPKGQFNGKWYDLRPYRTEGQGLKPGTKMYSNYSVCVPMGVGFKYALNRQWSIGLEYGLRMTFTDYIDDVSTVYYDRSAIGAAQETYIDSVMASYFSNPTLNLIPVVDGIDVTGVDQQRGDSEHKDSYMFISITVNYKISRFKKTHSKF